MRRLPAIMVPPAEYDPRQAELWLTQQLSRRVKRALAAWVVEQMMAPVEQGTRGWGGTRRCTRCGALWQECGHLGRQLARKDRGGPVNSL